MKLVKLRLRGLGEVPESDWIEMTSGLQVLQVRTAARQAALIGALQALNPPYRCRDVRPFADLPRQVVTRQGHTRRVAPQKRTIVIGVFSSSPELVQELAAISPLLYETDLIEVGRRLDYSRWINFIELASSTRWAEVAAEVDLLMDMPGRLSDNLATLSDLIGGLEPTERIKGELMVQLAAAIESARASAVPADQDRLSDLLQRILRARHFAAARSVIKARLPLLAAVDLNQLPSWRFGTFVSQPNARLPAALSFLFERLQSKLQAANASGRSELLTLLNHDVARQRRPGRPELLLRHQHHHLAYGIPAAGDRLHSIDGLPPLDRLDLCCRLIAALSSVLLDNQPILLFSLPQWMTQPAERDRLGRYLMEQEAMGGQRVCTGSAGWTIPGIESILVDDPSGS